MIPGGISDNVNISNAFSYSIVNILLQTLTSVLLKGNLEYQRGNYRKAMKVINSIPQSSLSFKYVIFIFAV